MRLVEESPTVSVIIPTRNRIDLLQRAVASVVRQTFTDWELLIIDDASDEDIRSALSDWQDPRVRVVRIPTPSGAPIARNRGIDLSRGRYVAFLDSDDEFVPEKLEIQLSVIRRESEVGCVLSGFVDRDQMREQTISPPTHITFRRLMYGPAKWVTTGQILTSAELAKRVRFDPNLVSFQDWDFLARLSTECRIVGLDAPLLIKHSHAGARVFAGSRVASGFVAIIEKHRSDLGYDSDRATYWHLRAAMSFGSLGDMQSARREIRGALGLRPLGFGLYPWIIASQSSFSFRAFLWVRYRIKGLFKGSR